MEQAIALSCYVGFRKLPLLCTLCRASFLVFITILVPLSAGLGKTYGTSQSVKCLKTSKVAGKPRCRSRETFRVHASETRKKGAKLAAESRSSHLHKAAGATNPLAPKGHERKGVGRFKRQTGKKTLHAQPAVAQLSDDNPEIEEQKVARGKSFAILQRAYYLYDLGVNQRIAGNYGEAISQLDESKRVLASASGNEAELFKPYVLLEIALAADAGHNFELAKQSYENCLLMSPKFLSACLKLSLLEARQGDLTAALAMAKRGIALEPLNPLPHSIAGLLFRQLGMTDEAKSEEEKVSELNYPEAASGSNAGLSLP